MFIKYVSYFSIYDALLQCIFYSKSCISFVFITIGTLPPPVPALLVMVCTVPLVSIFTLLSLG